jgi:hypothetical protein
MSSLASFAPAILKTVETIVGVIKSSPDPQRTAENLARMALHEKLVDEAMRKAKPKGRISK